MDVFCPYVKWVCMLVVHGRVELEFDRMRVMNEHCFHADLVGAATYPRIHHRTCCHCGYRQSQNLHERSNLGHGPHVTLPGFYSRYDEPEAECEPKPLPPRQPVIVSDLGDEDITSTTSRPGLTP